MNLKDQPIQRKLKSIILLTSTTVLLLTCAAFVTYEWIMDRQEMARNLSTLAEITALNSTAVLAFENESDAEAVLAALRVEKHIVAAALYDQNGKLFASYPTNQPASAFPPAPKGQEPRFAASHLSLFQPVIENDKRLGTLYLKSDLAALYGKFRLYAAIVLLVMAVSWLAAFAISAGLQKRIAHPILALAATAKSVSDRKDYSVRAHKVGEDELGLLTDAFNQMLDQIQERDSALRESEARKGAMLDSALDGIISMDHEGKLIEFNPAAQKIFGYSRDQVLGKEMADLIIPSSLREGHRRGLAHYLATGYGPILGKRIELTAQRADGTEFPVELSIIRVGSAEPPTFTGFLRDITERKRVEEALRHGEAKLQTIVENLAEGVAVSDLQGQLLHFNRAALDLHGFASLDECRRHLAEFADTFELSGLDGTVWPVGQWPLARILRGEKLRNLDVRIRRLQKDWQRVFSYGGTLVHDAGGQPMMAVVTVTDITERKRAEEEIRKLNQDLEERVSKRTAELETANKELEAFSYSVSHDLRAPLRGIAGFSQMIAKTYQGKLDNEGDRWLGLVQSETERMGRLIDDLLNFSRLGRQHMKSIPVDMTALAHKVFEELTTRKTEPTPKFDLKALPPALGDYTLLRQVLVNLLSNAIKFTRHREAASVEVGASSDGAENVYYVKDNGVGFDPKYSHKLFGVFQRLHSEDEFEGTGVGLALVQRIIHRHGGRIWAEAELGKGAAFYFALPTVQK